MSGAGVHLHIAWFPAAKMDGPAIGDPERISWHDFCGVVSGRRREEDEKDGPNFVPAKFKLWDDGKHVRRLGRNVIARTAVALDCEVNKQTGEAPPAFADATALIERQGWAGIIYTSHNHTKEATRYRIVLPLSEEIDPELPAVEMVADRLGLGGVLDMSKRGAASLFYLPSCPPGRLDQHAAVVIDGLALDAAWIREVAGTLLAQRQAEQDRIATAARVEAEARRQAKIAAGFDPDDSLIEKIRAHLDLEHILLSHGYDKRGTKYRHPNSTSGSFGADIKLIGGIERLYSHNGTDPLHRDNLPQWCGGVTAIDAFDVLAILDYNENRKAALTDLAQRFGISKRAESKTVARLIHRMREAGACQEAIEAAAFAEGARQGLSRTEVISVARYVVSTIIEREATI